MTPLDLSQARRLNEVDRAWPPPSSPPYVGAVAVLLPSARRPGRLFWFHTSPRLAHLHPTVVARVELPAPPAPEVTP